jgi:hypothetical protein
MRAVLLFAGKQKHNFVIPSEMESTRVFFSFCSFQGGDAFIIASEILLLFLTLQRPLKSKVKKRESLGEENKAMLFHLLGGGEIWL